MVWNYRVMMHREKNPLFGREPLRITAWADWVPEPVPEFNVCYMIHEVFYKDDGSIDNWTEDGMELYGETLEELRENFGQMLEAFKFPVLDYSTGEEVS